MCGSLSIGPKPMYVRQGQAGRQNNNHSLHVVDASSCRTSALDDRHERTGKADAEGELQRLWFQLARMLPRTHIIMAEHATHKYILHACRPHDGRREGEAR